jgi:hypothetical protein
LFEKERASELSLRVTDDPSAPLIESDYNCGILIGDEAVIEWMLLCGRRDLTAVLVSGAIGRLPHREPRRHTLGLGGRAPHSVTDEGIKQSA